MKDFISSDRFLWLNKEEQRAYLLFAINCDKQGVVINPLGIITKYEIDDEVIDSLKNMQYISMIKDYLYLRQKSFDINE